ncbi:hypothetical protein NKH47_12300 [Mesorhizobium sp. M1060]|uniref:hypothetical protein n=1 Tax=Mesorhizobium sp. M1060 TaxID=2957052 RepID=UPI00333A57AA
MTLSSSPLHAHGLWRGKVVEDTCIEALHCHEHAALLIWKDALQCEQLTFCMSAPDWPLALLQLMPRRPTMGWCLKGGGGAAVTDQSEVARAVEAACGAEGKPCGNVHAVLPIRTYADQSGEEGTLPWWRSQLEWLTMPPMARAFSAATAYMLERAEVGGSQLCIEEISLVISSDPSAPLATLTPTLHADAHYGDRESAIVSLSSPLAKVSGTHFVPCRTMEELWDLRPIRMADLAKVADAHEIYTARSGDLALYSGMKGPDGIARRCNGVPHISPDYPGSGVRLVVLLRHRRTSEGQ